MPEISKMEALQPADLRYNDEIEDPWNPPYLPCPPSNDDTKPHWEHANEWFLKTAAFVANSRATNIIVPDRTPQWVSDALRDKVPELVSILEEDDVQRFLHFFSNNKRCMAWGFIITPETFNYIISENAMQCAEVVLEGKVPELSGHRASPNCMNPYGYFPLHEAAERFSVDMINLLIRYGASANVRTAGKEIKENLLPLHVAVENTCLHKYLEDNLFPCQDHRDYIFKLIQLLCLPEMKIFLDTTRLLGKRTNNLIDELWRYVEDGKLVQTAVLLLAAQESIRVGSFSKKKGICKADGFDSIMARMTNLSVAVKRTIGENGRAHNQLEASSVLECTVLLVDLISRAGEALDKYIQTHSEVPHVEILECVSSILKDYGFSPNGKGIDVKNLRPFDCEMFAKRGHCGDLDATNVATRTAYPHATEEKAVRNRLARGCNLEYTRNSFFPYWRSVLLSHVDVMIFPAYAAADPKCKLNLNKQHCNSHKVSTKIANRSLGLLGRTQEATGCHAPSRLFGTYSLGRTQQITSNNISGRLFYTAALTLLKVLKNA